MKNPTTRQWGMLFALISLGVLAAVFISQYIFGMAPCKLCLWQRIPYGLALVAGLWLWFKPGQNPRSLFGLLVVIFLSSVGLALFHFGVENKWWQFASDCSGNAFKPGASPEEVLAALKKAPTARCDEAQPFLFGMSMAFYNMLASLALAVLAAYAFFRPVSRNIPG